MLTGEHSCELEFEPQTRLKSLNCLVQNRTTRNYKLRAGSLGVLFARVSWRRKSASEASQREEWGEEKLACTKAVEF